MPPLEDTQSQPDHRQVLIPRVGIRGLRYPVTIQRPDGPQFAASATAALMADLAASERGTHMSRFVSLLHEHREGITPARLVTMAKELRARLGSPEAQIILELPWFVEKYAPVTGAPGICRLSGHLGHLRQQRENHPAHHRGRPRRHPLPLLQSHQRTRSP